MERNILAATIRKLAGENGIISQADLARESGLKPGTINGYIKKGNIPSTISANLLLPALIALTDYSAEELREIGYRDLYGEDSPEFLIFLKAKLPELKAEIKAELKEEAEAEKQNSKTPQHIDIAVEILSEALKESKAEITNEEKKQIIESLRKNLKMAAEQEKNRIVEMLKVFKSS